MLHSQKYDLVRLGKRLSEAGEANAAIVTDIINGVCRRFPALGLSEKTARLAQLMSTGAWTDVALALIDLELPQWQLRRLVYDDGEWYCALSRERELPDWLDRAVEARHASLALAILGAFIEAQRINPAESRPSVPVVNRTAPDLYAPVCSDNFG